ncbi:hypothetical protein CEXT_29441 [Caerostris extrusa]|uniref:Ribosomal protein S4 n=1 Tax=Caerostris extrusa TaxID=172846 RepID=A0AAV4XVR4_CAEEX|nr:hypothetical protein CEXT_29441 [Caerostris extrusa]
MIRKPKLKSNKIPPAQNSRDILQNLPVVYSHATKTNPAYAKAHLKRNSFQKLLQENFRMIRKPKLKSNKIPPAQDSRDILQNLPRCLFACHKKTNPAYAKKHILREMIKQLKRHMWKYIWNNNEIQKEFSIISYMPHCHQVLTAQKSRKGKKFPTNLGVHLKPPSSFQVKYNWRTQNKASRDHYDPGSKLSLSVALSGLCGNCYGCTFSPGVNFIETKFTLFFPLVISSEVVFVAGRDHKGLRCLINSLGVYMAPASVWQEVIGFHFLGLPLPSRKSRRQGSFSSPSLGQ